MNPMSFDEMIAYAKSQGYLKVQYHDELMNIDDFQMPTDKMYEVSETGLIGVIDGGMTWYDSTTFVKLHLVK